LSLEVELRALIVGESYKYFLPCSFSSGIGAAGQVWGSEADPRQKECFVHPSANQVRPITVWFDLPQ
jgi:hypothetical protein